MDCSFGGYQVLRQFREDPFYLARYHASVCLVLSAATGLVFWLRPPSWTDLLWFLPAMLMMTSVKIQVVLASVAVAIGTCLWRTEFHLWHLALPVIATAVSFSFVALIHNSAHNSLRPRWLNRPVGELVGLLQLSGFPDWKITHVLHHAHSDDPVLDPHPPGHKGYWEFTVGMRDSVVKAYLVSFFRIFPRDERSMRAVKTFAICSKLGQALKILFLFSVLGPVLFSWLFVPSIAAKMLQFAWANWAAHRPEGDGFVIRDLDHGWYKIANFFSFGTYVHASHHEVPTLFDPRDLAKRRAQGGVPGGRSSSSHEAA